MFFRVAEERGERISADRRDRENASVGYEIRFENVQPRSLGSIMFCTTGIVLHKLRENPDMNRVSHIILDEVHERDLQTDVLLGALKELLIQKRESDLKIIIMSASLNAELFSEYLEVLCYLKECRTFLNPKFLFQNCPQVEIPVRAHPVHIHYLENVLDILGRETDDIVSYGYALGGAQNQGRNRTGPPSATVSEYRYDLFKMQEIAYQSIIFQSEIWLPARENHEVRVGGGSEFTAGSQARQPHSQQQQQGRRDPGLLARLGSDQ